MVYKVEDEYKNENNKSIHGELISNVVNYWFYLNVFEMIDERLKSSLLSMLKKYFPDMNIRIDIANTPEKIDGGCFSGDIFFKKETGEESVIHFTMTNTPNTKEGK